MPPDEVEAKLVKHHLHSQAVVKAGMKKGNPGNPSRKQKEPQEVQKAPSDDPEHGSELAFDVNSSVPGDVGEALCPELVTPIAESTRLDSWCFQSPQDCRTAIQKETKPIRLLELCCGPSSTLTAEVLCCGVHSERRSLHSGFDLEHATAEQIVGFAEVYPMDQPAESQPEDPRARREFEENACEIQEADASSAKHSLIGTPVACKYVYVEGRVGP